ncbi:hypothetical protein ACHWQZ_G001902 [Mnemiopsis leidyi]
MKYGSVSKLLCFPTTQNPKNKKGLRKICSSGEGGPLPPHLRPGELSPEPAQPVSVQKNRGRYYTISYDLLIMQLLNEPNADNSLYIKTNPSRADVYQHAYGSEKYSHRYDYVPITKLRTVYNFKSFATYWYCPNLSSFTDLPVEQKKETYSDSPRDTSEGNNSNQNNSSTNSHVSQLPPRRKNISGRGALFNGSRNWKKTTGSDDDGEDDEENKRLRQRLLNQCEVSQAKEVTKDQKKASNSNTPSDLSHQNTNTEIAEWGNAEPGNWTGTISPIVTSDCLTPYRRGQQCNNNVNSTALNQSHAGYHLFDTSLLQGISRIWQSARNVSLFGTSYIRQHTSPGLEIVGRLPAETQSDESLGSDLEDQMPDISEISFSALQNQTVVEQTDVGQNDRADNGTNTNQMHTPEPDCFIGIANPEITPVTLHVRESKTFLTPLNRSGTKIRTKSECSPFVRCGPYEIPQSIVIRKSKRTEIRFNLRDNRGDQTPLGRRKRTSSDSFCSSPGNMEINCIRARETGLYDCSSGLGEYFHLEQEFMDKPDTGRIDKQKLLKTIEKFITISGDQQPLRTPNSVQLSWDSEEVLAVSENCPVYPACHLDQRKNLVYLLGRMISHTTRLTGNRLTYNGINMTVLPSQNNFSLQCPENCPGQPVVALYIGKGVDVNIVPKKRDWIRPNVHDIHMENFSLLTIFPETHSHMNISIPGERKEEEVHLLITPCFIEKSRDITQTDKTINDPPKSETNREHMVMEDQRPVKRDGSSESFSYEKHDERNPVPINTMARAPHENREKSYVDKNKNPFEPTSQPVQVPTANQVTPEKHDSVDLKAHIENNLGHSEANFDHDKIHAGEKTNVTGCQANNVSDETSVGPNHQDCRNVLENGAPLNSSIQKPKPNHCENLNVADPEIIEENDAGDPGTIKDPLPQPNESAISDPCRSFAKPFLSKETVINICNSNSGSKIIDWLKLCNLRQGNTAEANRKIILNYLGSAAEGKVKLPPVLVEKLVKKLNNEAVKTEILNIGIDLPKKAANRKSALAMYLTSEFTTLNLMDYNETCELEMSRLGANKKHSKGHTKNRKSKNKSKTRKNNETRTPKSGNNPGSEIEGALVTRKVSQNVDTDPEGTAAKTKRVETKCDSVDNLNETLDAHAKDEKKDTDPDQMLNESPKRRTESAQKREIDEGLVVEKTKSKEALDAQKNTDRNQDAPERSNGKPNRKTKAIPSSSGGQARPTAASKKTSVVESNPGAAKNKQIAKGLKDTTHNVNADNKPRDLEKPLRTLEASLLKLQDNVNIHGEQIRLLSKEESAPGRIVAAECKQQQDSDLLDLKNKVDTLLRTIEVQQEALSQLTDRWENQTQIKPPSPCISAIRPRSDSACQQCKEEIAHLNAKVSFLLNEFTTLKKIADKPCPVSYKNLQAAHHQVCRNTTERKQNLYCLSIDYEKEQGIK